MKISFMLILLSVLNISATNILSQNRVAINYINEIRETKDVATVKDLLDEIERKGEISFLYNDNLHKELYKQVSLSSNEDANALENALSNAGIMMEEVEEGFFVLKPAPEEPLTAYVNVPAYKDAKQQNQITVTGTVTSADDEEPIPGVSVAVSGTTIGTTTDVDGHYELEVPDEDAILEFSFVGKERQEIMVGDQRTIDVELEPDVVGLDEVVVTGYGVQRRRDLTGSVSSVRSSEFEGMPVESVQRALQGRAAGVQITGVDGAPGGDIDVIVRGMGSFASNRPTWIIDGVEVQSEQIGSRGASSSPLASLDFDDIESIDILKDASATAIYGARGAAGVIIVETKRGEALEETNFNFEVRGGFTEPIRERPVMDGPTWAKWDFERYVNRYGMDSPQVQDRIEHGEYRGWYEVGADGLPDFTTTPHYDWMGETHRGGNTWQARLTARGGDETTRYYTSLSRNETDGHIYPYWWERTNFRFNFDQELTDRLTFDMQINASVTDQQTSRLGGAWSSPTHGAAGVLPVEPIYTWQAEEAGIAHIGRDHYGYFNGPQSVYGANPRHVMNSLDMDHTQENIAKAVGNFSLNYTISDNLTYRGSFGVDYTHSAEEQWYDPRAGDAFDIPGRLREYEQNVNILQTTQTITYDQVFGDVHEFDGVAGFETHSHELRRTMMRGENFPTYHTNVMDAAGEIAWWSGRVEKRTRMGSFARLNYTYDGRYLFTLTGRYDGSSRFGAENRWGFFPAASMGWRVSDEPFMAGLDRIDNLMVRLGYGVSGTDAAGTYAALGLWGGGGEYLGVSGLYPSQLPNRYLTWEESRTLNLAVNFGGFDGRVNLDLDLFNRWSEELLLDRPLPLSSGWSSITENVGSTLNQGVEISLYTVNIDNENFRWTTDFNFTFVESEIQELLPGVDFFDNRRHVGQPMTARYIPQWAGVNPADGRPMYYDEDQNITYMPSFDDRKWMGTEEPTRYGGITNEFRIGNFETSIFFQYAGGNRKYQSDMRFFFGWTGDRGQYERVYTDRWQEPGDITDVPMPVLGSAYPGNVQNHHTYASHMFQRADYIRLKDLTIAYNIPETLTQRYGIEDIRVFMRGSNLITWTDYLGTDPEVVGTDYGTYPQGRSLTFGINTNF